MKLEINKFYKVLVGEDIELQKEYEYLVCIGELDDHWLLHEVERWAKLNEQGEAYDDLEDVDEYFKYAKELDVKHYKKFNSLESVYYKNKTIGSEPTKKKNKFVLT